MAALGQPGLLKIVFRYLPTGFGEVVPDGVGALGVEHQRPAEGFGQHLLGQVVAGGPQAAGGDDDVRPAPGQLHRRPEPLGVVPYHGVVIDIDAHGGQFPAQVPGIGIEDVAQQQFGAH